jgi:UDP-N-acetylmuramate--alanine ligase
VDADMLVEGIRQYGQKNIHLVNQVQDVAAFLEGRVQEGDLVITLGAGDVHQAGRALLRLLAGEESD